MLKQVDTFRRNSRTSNTTLYINWQEIIYLQAVWEQLHFELLNLEKHLPTSRQKRGLLHFGGNVLHFLFGTATSAEL
jgi:hypothetical protein